MSRLLLLCPGQGGQHPGMFEMARQHPKGTAMFERLGIEVPDEASLFTNRAAQPAIVAASLAMWEALRDDVPKPALVAGYSIGELAAHAVAGTIEAGEAVRLAGVRARLMDDAATAGQCMVALGGLAVSVLSDLARHHGFEVAIINGDDACVAGGLQAQLAALQAAVVAAGGRCEALPVAVASHTHWMRAAVAPFAAALAASPMQAPACPVLSGIAAARVVTSAQAADTLARQLAQTVVWNECMDAAAEAGITVALELGPGAALARMLQARHSHIACRSVADFRSVGGVSAWLARHIQ
jgi:[acyl-carrier-protein] S-malonyltransferase